MKEKEEFKKKKIEYERKEELLKFIIILFIFLFILVIVYYFFLHTKKCPDQQCFADALLSCKKAKWTNDAEEATWIYTINGRSGDNCEVEVRLHTIKKGKLDLGKAEGKSMNCYLPIGVVESPEQDLGNCKGELKEDLQDLIIKRMHSYILENLGDIGEELISPL